MSLIGRGLFVALTIAAGLSARAEVALANPVFSNLPLAFEKNVGQFDPAVEFFARGSGYSVSLAKTRASFLLPNGSAKTITLNLVGAAGASAGVVGERLGQESNYFIGPDPSRWKTGVPHYASVTYPQAYPGIDVVYYASESRIEYDFVVQPGADPSKIALRFDGVKAITSDDEGNLLLDTGAGVLKQLKPHVYQQGGGKRLAVDARYVKRSDGLISVRLGAYDKSKPLTIDPVITYATYFGGSQTEYLGAFAVDSAGNSYLSGITNSTNLPLLNPLQATSNASATVYVGFVTKLNKSGNAIVFSTYFGGTSGASVSGMALGADGSIYLGGSAGPGFPTTAGVLQPTYGGASTAYVAKLSPSGNSMVFATYFGVASSSTKVAVNADGSVVLAGTVSDVGSIATTPGALFTSNRGGYVARLDSAGTAVQMATYFDPVYALALGGAGDIYITGGTTRTDLPVVNAIQATKRMGSDAFITKLSAAGAVVFSTYYGGDGDGPSSPLCYTGNDYGTALAVDAAGSVIVAGTSYSPYSLITNKSWGTGTIESYSGFLVKLAPAGNPIVYAGRIAAGNNMVYSACLGTDATDLALDANGNALVVGYARESNLLKLNELWAPFGQYVLGIDPSGDPFISTGLWAQKVGVDGLQNIYGATLGGAGASTTSAFQDTFQGGQDLFVTKITSPRAAIAIASSSSTIEQGQSVTFTASLQGLPAAGTVTFMEADTPIGSVALIGASATFSTSALSPGIRKLRAEFSHPDFPQSISSRTLYQAVNQPAVCP